MRRVHIVFLISVFLIGGCATPTYKKVFKDSPSYNSKEYFSPQDTVYQAAMKAVCSKNFIIEQEDEEKGFILAKRSFQRGKRTTVVAVQVKITSFESDTSTLYLNALETTERMYVADRTRFFMFLIPLPGGGGKEAYKVKEGEKIIEDKEFYQSFFSLIDEELRLLESSKIDREPEENSHIESEEASTPEQ